MAYPNIVLNAISGTGLGNQWTAGGATVGDDQSGVGGTASYISANYTRRKLSVNLANASSSYNSYPIQKITLTCRLKQNDVGSIHYVASMLYTHSTYYYTDTAFLVSYSTVYNDYTIDFYTNPNTGSAWTWTEVNDLVAGCTSLSGDSGFLYYADYTAITVWYKAWTGTSALTLKAPTVSATGTVVHRIGTSAVTLVKPAVSATAQRHRTGTSALALKAVTLVSSGYYTHKGTSAVTLKIPVIFGASVQWETGVSHPSLPIPAVSATGIKVISGRVGAQTFTKTTNVSIDTFIWSVNVTNNYGADIQSRVRNYLGYFQKSLLKFTVDALQYSTTATLSLNVDYEAGLNSKIIASRLLKNWTEGTGTIASPTTNDATWNNYTTGTAWATAGAGALNDDYAEEIIDSVSATGWKSINIKTFINEWSAGTDNYGLILWSDADSFFRFTTKDNASLIPYITQTIETTNLPQITVSASGRVNHLTGTSTVSLINPVVASAGYYIHNGTSALTLPINYLVSIGIHYSCGTSDINLPVLTTEATGLCYAKIGTIALYSPILYLNANGLVVDEYGTSAITLPLVEVDGYSNLIVGTSQLTFLFVPDLTSSGLVGRQGTSALTYSIVSLASSGTVTNIGTSALTLPQIQIVSSGIVINEGTASLTLPVILLVSSGEAKKVGTSSIGLPINYLTGAGFIHDFIYGISALMLPQIDPYAIAVYARTGTSACVLPQITVVSSGYYTHKGTSSITLPVINISSNAIFSITGTSSLNLIVPTLTSNSVVYFNVILDAVSGTGIGNEWIAGGATVGDDQSGIGGTESTCNPPYTPPFSAKKLSVNFETFITNPAYPITYVKLVSRLKKSTSNAAYFEHHINGYRSFISTQITSTYIEYSYIWYYQPEIPIPFTKFTWSYINSIYGGVLAQNDNAYYVADHTYLEVLYEKALSATSNIILPQISLSATGHRNRIGTSVIVLPSPVVTATGHKQMFWTGTSALTLPVPTMVTNAYVATSYIVLPKIQLTAVANLIRYATSAITLPQIQVNATAVYYNAGTSTLTLPLITLQANAVYFRSGTASLTLPVCILNATAVYFRYGSAILTLPILTISSIGHRVLIVNPISLTLPVPTLSAIGHRILMVHPISLTLPQIFFTTRGHFFPKGYESWLWAEFKAQMQTNTTLNSYIKAWYFNRKVRILSGNYYPFIQMYPTGTINEQYRRLKYKTTDLMVTIHCKTQNGNSQVLRSELYVLDELIKETIEQDIHIGNQALIAKPVSTEFNYLSESIGELIIIVALTTNMFPEAGRTYNVNREIDDCILGLPTGISLSAIGTVV